MSTLDNYRKIEKKIKDSGIPIIAGLEVTYSCNLSCRHCYVAAENGRELCCEEYYGLIDALFDLGTFCLVFTGGEPLLKKDFFSIAGYAKKKGFLTVLFTNGSLIDERTADKIKENSFWKIEISICGGTAPTHDRITQTKGSFEKTLTAVRLLRERGLDVTLKTLLVNLNIHEYHLMKELAHNLEVNLRTDVQITPKMDGSLAPLRYGISKEQIAEVIKDRGDVNYFECGSFSSASNLTCNAGKHMVSVSPTGEVKPCIIFPVTCGTIRENSIKDIWHTDNGILKQLRTLQIADLVKCPECDYMSYCIRCHAASYLQTGTMVNPLEASCDVAKIRYELSLERGENDYEKARHNQDQKRVCEA